MIELTCKICTKKFSVRNSKSNAKYCSRKCSDKSKIGKTTWNKNTKGLMPTPWNKNTKGIMKANKTSFKKGEHFSPKTEFKKGQYLGINHPRWKNGEKISTQGYTLLNQPSHPKADKHGYVKRANLIVEKHINRFLKKGELVHHVNKNRLYDNPMNLICFINQSAHIRFHHNPHNVKPREIIFDGRYLI